MNERPWKRGDQMPRHAARSIATATVALGLLLGTGCGSLFSKQEKPMRVELEFIGGDSLNFDGQSVQAVQVKAYLLRQVDRFAAADARAIFNPEFDPGFPDRFAPDTLGSVTLIVAPKEVRTAAIEIPFIRARDSKPQLGVIANFAVPSGERGRERLVLKIPKKTHQTVRIELGKNWIVKAKK